MKAHDRVRTRQYFYDAWNKFNEHQPLEDFEKQIVDIVINHPEYQFIFEDPERYLNKDFQADLEEVNPFMHFTLHMSLIDLLKNDEPKGIRQIYNEIKNKVGDVHQTDHYFMELLANEMHDALQNHRQMNMENVMFGAKQLLGKLG